MNNNSNNEGDNLNIFFSNPNNNEPKPDLMAQSQAIKQNTVNPEPISTQSPDLMNQTPNIINQTIQPNNQQALNYNDIQTPTSVNNQTIQPNILEPKSINNAQSPIPMNQAPNISNPSPQPINQQTTNFSDIQNQTPTPVNNQTIQPNIVEPKPINSVPITNNAQPQSTINNQAMPNNIQQPINIESDEELLKAYVGKNYDKITKKKFNFSAFFFGSLYLCYRKMLLFGLLLFIITIIATNFISPIISLLLMFIMGLATNQFYINYANKKIKQIKDKHPDSSREELISLCTSKGGTSFPRLIVGLIIQLIVAIIVALILSIIGLSSLFGNLINDFMNRNNSGFNTTFEGANGVIIYDSSININDEFHLTPVGPFQDESDEYGYEYGFRYEESADIFNECSFSLYAVTGFSDGDDLIRQLVESNSDNIVDNIATQSINDINWTWFSETDRIGTTYHYGTTKDNKAYLFEYQIDRGTSLDCDSYRETILNSIVKE